MSEPIHSRHESFRALWWICNLLLAVSLASLVYGAGWEYSVRHYLKGFSDAIIPAAAPPEQKIEAILTWMRTGPPRPVAASIEGLSKRDPETTLNYKQLLTICGTATNAFLNLSRSAGLEARRLLLLSPDRNTKHVVAEVLIDGRWIIVDPTYRVVMRDTHGKYLTRKELQDPIIFAQATGGIPDYPSTYSYEKYAHVRIARLPMDGLGIRHGLDTIFPGWDESLDWSLLLERESFFVLVVSLIFSVFFLAMRVLLAWYADHRLLMRRFQLRDHLFRAGATFFSTPEIKE